MGTHYLSQKFKNLSKPKDYSTIRKKMSGNFGLVDQAAMAQAIIREIVDGTVLTYVFSEMLRRQGLSHLGRTT